MLSAMPSAAVRRRLKALTAQTDQHPGTRSASRSPAAGVADPALRAGVGKQDITQADVLVPGVDVNQVLDGAGSTNAASDNLPMYAKALLIERAALLIGFVTLDVVSFGEIGHIPGNFLANVRARIQNELGLDPTHFIFNVSHGHGIPCDDVEDRTIAAIAAAKHDMTAVAVGSGRAHVDTITENRRTFLKDGSEADTRGAYSSAPDGDVAEIGPIDPSVGILRIDRLEDGASLAVVYNFACHPIMGTPSGANGADLTGFASELIEDGFTPGVTMALFLQGCSGDVNPIGYKDVDHPKDALPLGLTLGHAVLKAARGIETSAACEVAALAPETLQLPRVDASARIEKLEAARMALAEDLQGTHLDLKTFVPLLVKYQMEGGGFPSGHASRYMHEEAMGRNGLTRLDQTNRSHLSAYVENVHRMEEMSRLNENIRLLKMHRGKAEAAGEEPLEAEVVTIKISGMVLTTFPGELSVRIGLALKERSPHSDTFITCYSNGYIFYAPTEEQLANLGAAQEDCDVMVGPGWQRVYEDAVERHLAEV